MLDPTQSFLEWLLASPAIAIPVGCLVTLFACWFAAHKAWGQVLANRKLVLEIEKLEREKKEWEERERREMAEKLLARRTESKRMDWVGLVRPGDTFGDTFGFSFQLSPFPKQIPERPSEAKVRRTIIIAVAATLAGITAGVILVLRWAFAS